MSSLSSIVASEALKARRSLVPWGVAGGLTLAPLVIGLFMLILQNPDAARSLGVLGSKAALSGGTADWPTFLLMLGQALTVGGAVLFAFLTAWIFGREFADRTVRELLAVPTRRRTIVLGKSLVVAAWATATIAWALALGLIIGFLLGLPDWSPDDAIPAISAMALGALLTVVLQTVAALAASVGRGYLAPLAWAVVTVVVSQVVAVLGWGSWFPW